MIQSKTLARLLTAAGAALMSLALLAPAAQATNPGYEAFAGCPNKAELVSCVRVDVTGGHLKMGNKDTPITKTITLTGGIKDGGDGFQGTILEAKQKVPGGVIGLTGLTWLAEFLGIEALTLYAVTELAGTPSVITDPVILPIKVHLINSALGSNCRVGSNASPITLKLTTGTTSPPPPNTPITGKEPEVSFDETTEIIHAKNGEYVDNAFAAPGANGCVLTLFGFIPISINGLVNTASALPAAAGTNETRQNYNLQLVASDLVW